LDLIKLLISKGCKKMIEKDISLKYNKYLANILCNNNKFWFLSNILSNDLTYEIKKY
jgi:hypothetical protein